MRAEMGYLGGAGPGLISHRLYGRLLCRHTVQHRLLRLRAIATGAAAG